MSYSSEEKFVFIEMMKAKTKKFAVDVVDYCDELPLTPGSRNIIFQLIKSATSTGANYRAACRGRSKKEFHAKMSITVEEADESEYWLEVLQESKIKDNAVETSRLLNEISEILKVVSKARKSNSE